jgi:hypothetical protein
MAVKTWGEFVEAVAVENAVVEIENSAYFDFNEIAPTGLNESVTVNCSVINANGAVFKNLTVNSASVLFRFYNPIKINDLNFHTFSLIKHGTSDPRLFWGGDKVEFIRCRVSGILQDETYLGGSNYGCDYVSFNQCSLNLKINNGGLGMSYSSDPVGKDFMFKYYDSLVEINGKYDTKNARAAFYLDNSELKGIIDGNMAISGINSKVYLRMQNDGEISRVFRGWSEYVETKKIIVNTDIATISPGHEKYYIAANSQQINDVMFLENEGFPLGVG